MSKSIPKALIRAALCVLLCSVLFACRPARDAVAVRPASGTRVALAALLEEVTGAKPRDFMTFDFGRDRDSRALSVVVPEPKVLDLVRQLRPQIPQGWLAFAGTDTWLGKEEHQGQVELVVAPGADQFDILRLARSDAANYDMMTEDLIRKLKTYDAMVGLDILQANSDTIVAQMKALPPDLPAFANDVYKFCPDIVDQGVGSGEALQSGLAESRLLFLWWD